MPVDLIAVIVVVWVVLLGLALAARRITARWVRMLLVTSAYCVLAAVALGYLGITRSGLLGAFGMLLPYACAVLVTVIAV